MTRNLLIVLLSGAVFLAACGKEEAPPVPAPAEEEAGQAEGMLSAVKSAAQEAAASAEQAVQSAVTDQMKDAMAKQVAGYGSQIAALKDSAKPLADEALTKLISAAGKACDSRRFVFCVPSPCALQLRYNCGAPEREGVIISLRGGRLLP